MKLINATGSDLNATMVAGAKAAYNPGGLRPSQSVKSLTLDPTSDIFVYMVKLRDSPIGDSVTILQGNPFRIIEAYNEVMQDGITYPYIAWKGGNPPFQIQLAHIDIITGEPSNIVTGMSYNLNPNLTDGTGDIVTSSMAREYIIEHEDTDDGWFSDDLHLTERSDEIGLLITDSSVPGISLFAPFKPVVTFGEDGTTKTGMSAIYEMYGPPTLDMVVLWVPDVTRPYGEYFWDKSLYPAEANTQFTAATSQISATGTIYPSGSHAYYTDELFTAQIVGYAQPDVGSVTYYYRFVPTDLVTYQVAVKKRTFTIEKALPVVVWAITSYSYGNLTWAVFKSPIFRREDNRGGITVVAGTPTTTLESAIANNAASFYNSAAYIEPDDFDIVYAFTPSDTGRYVPVTRDVHAFSVAKNTPVINHGTSFSYLRGAITYYQLMVLMQLSNSWRGEVAPWIITPSSGSGYTYAITNHEVGITMSTEDSSAKLSSAIPSDTAFNIAMSWNPQGDNALLYNAVSANFNVAIAGWPNLVGTWTCIGSTSLISIFKADTNALVSTTAGSPDSHLDFILTIGGSGTATYPHWTGAVPWTRPGGKLRIVTREQYWNGYYEVYAYQTYETPEAVSDDVLSMILKFDYWHDYKGVDLIDYHEKIVTTLTFTRPR